ncbi:MAG TPA: FAD-binding oxidoreductase [Methylomirabilota bacterium]|jgi:4-methylaminobutanoate oxidase (formaldehyde-forming)|nr:FAD-binding oxidoreductase [Methylomirabilota bacterium]
MERARVIVVGGGFWGCSTLWHLAARGLTDCLLVEQGELAGETTGQAAGMIGQLRTSAVASRAATYGVELLRRFDREVGSPSPFREVGSVKVALTAGRVEELRRQVADARRLGLAAVLVAPAEAARLAPGLDKRRIRAAAHVASDGYLDPAATARALAAAAERAGARVWTGTRVTGISVGRDRVRGVSTERGPVRADTVVVAAGPWAGRLAATAGIELPLYPVRHQLAVTSPLDGLPDWFPLVRVPDAGAYLRPDGRDLWFGRFERRPASYDPRRLGPGFRTKDVPPGQGALRTARARLREIFPLLGDAAVVHARAGLPGFTPDGEHLVGALPRPRGLVIVAGCSATGIMDGLAMGRVAAELVAGERPFLDIEGMDPARFGRRYARRAALRAACEGVYRNYYSLRAGRV